MNLTRERLLELYACGDKHGAYQQLPDFLIEAYGIKAPVDENWRGDGSRWGYMMARMNFADQHVVDIGANTGYFSLNLARLGTVKKVTACEPNSKNALFISEIAKAFSFDNLSLHRELVTMATLKDLPVSDTVLLLNVLHHAGHDFDHEFVRRREDLFKYIVEYLRILRQRTGRLVFQMGFNWGGDKSEPVVAVPNNVGKVRYVADALGIAGWQVQSVALVVDTGTRKLIDIDFAYWLGHLAHSIDAPKNLDPHKRLQMYGASTGLSEFYARPLFVCV